MSKVLWTLNVGDYAPEITRLTYPLLRHYAMKIGAEFRVISERKFPGWPPVYEKLQIYELGRENEWNIFIDSDALVHPDMFDVTGHLDRDTVCHWGTDCASVRWRYDRYFRRDGRHIGSCNWFAVASDWCIDLWRPLDDLSLAQAVANIFPVVGEVNSDWIEPAHLIDDYTLSRNISKYGLKLKTVRQIQKDMDLFVVDNLGKRNPQDTMWHSYSISIPAKENLMREILKVWGIEKWMEKQYPKQISVYA